MITLDQNTINKLNNGMASSEAIQLPFPAPFLWAVNGQPGYKQVGGALYYGGWACKAEDLSSICRTAGIAAPSTWKPGVMSSRDGGEFEVFHTRSVIIAPIAKRESWLIDNKRVAYYVEGSRRHLQVLAYLAVKNGQAMEPWGPVVLTAKGYQAQNLSKAFNFWDKATVVHRNKIAPGVPAWCFYLAIGTFGDQRQVVQVGKSGAASPITPIGAYVPENMSEAMVESLYVGVIATIMADYQDRASEWLGAWKIDKSGSENTAITGSENFSDENPF